MFRSKSLHLIAQAHYGRIHSRVALLLAGLALLLAAGLASLWLWVDRPLSVSNASELSIPSGSSSARIAQTIGQQLHSPRLQTALFSTWIRISGKSAELKAGSYTIEANETPRSLIEKIAAGRQSLLSITIVEGWSWRQLRAALSEAADLRQDSASLEDAQIMERLGQGGAHPEGRFFPDTYRYAKGTSDLSLLKTALAAMDKQLAAAWEIRASDLPLQSPSEALTLASIVEKETGLPRDRATIGGVFINRLKIGMRLQTDPSVIYGMGDQYEGRIRKRDLQTDTPYNTYTRAGLPPTPIAMPGKAALLAAVQPASTKALYFVSRGDGSSEFSDNLDAHNRAVNRYIRGR